jgi:serine/threonine protein kinase
MREGRWTTVTPSRFSHEREALDHIRQLMPDAEPYRAWSNFTFTADTGHVHEVDLLVAARSGLYLIEIKSLHGKLTSSGSNWILTNQQTRTFDNPLHLADAKAKRLKSLLEGQARRQGVRERIPFVQGAVFLSIPGLQVTLPDHQLHWVYGPEASLGQPATTLPGIWSGLLGRTPQDERRRMTPTLSKALPKLLEGVGIARSRRYYQVGSWQLEATPFDIGPTWQDHLAKHGQLPHERRRVRIYLVERNAVKDERASIERAARREMLALHGVNHPGIVQADAMEPHEAGPALIFRHDPRAVRLDHYLSQYSPRLDVATRIGMIRQLAEAVAYAHSRRLCHRALSARSVLVRPDRRRGREPEEAAWLRPLLQISDWQAATRDPDTTGRASPERSIRVSPSSHARAHLERSAEGYLAPELSAPDQDPVALDVFGLGALSYLLLSGEPPATSRTELMGRLARDNGLRPSASADSVSEFMDELVQAATAPVPAQRLATVAEFLELLESVEDEITAPPPTTTPTAKPEPELDLLDATPGDLVGEWLVTKRLGTGSTSRAFLAENQRTGAREVLKVALSDEKASRLAHEAEVLRPLSDSRIIRLARQEPIEVGCRTVIVLEHAGDLTVARKLREDGRLTVDELETYADYLFGAVDYLEGEGVHHRDIKPDNIAIRVRPNRTRQLVLFDFSLAGAAVTDIEAGTPRYLDPFLGTPTRPVYDDHAERYAVAVTLHEMASGELPVWGDGATDAHYTDGPPVLAAEAFDAAIRDGLVAFFSRALDRDARQRFASLKDMHDAWQQVFRRSDRSAPVGSVHPDDDEAGTRWEERDEAAARATRATVLEASGLTPRAVSAAHRLEATTVGELIGLGSKLLFSLPGLGAKTRGELQRRVREWRARLGEQEPSPLPSAEPVAVATDAGGDAAEMELARVGLDTIAATLVPSLQKNARNRAEVEATRLLLRLPDRNSVLPDLPPWPQQPAVAALVGVTPGRVAQILSAQRKRWAAAPVVQSVRSDLVELLAANGRVMAPAELATALLERRGSTATGTELRRAIGMAAVRAAVEVDALRDEKRLLTRRHGDRLLIALEVSADDPENTPAAPALLDHADALGQVADRLAAQEVLPSPATVLRELAAASSRSEGAGIVLDGRRTVQLAALASQRAAASPRLEIYPRDLDLVRALRLAQAGVPPAPIGAAEPAGLSPKQVHERVWARFPELSRPPPEHPALDKLLAEAGFNLVWRSGRYYAPHQPTSGSRSTLIRRRTTGSKLSYVTADSPQLAAALRAEQRLAGAGGEGGFRALTVRLNGHASARAELVGRFGARPFNVAARFVATLRELVSARPKPTWEKVLDADAAQPGSRDALKLAEYARAAWEAVYPELLDAVAGDGPLLLHDAAPLARYRAMDLLEAAADAGRSGAGAVWLLCPADDPAQPPRLDDTVVPVVTENEWIVLPDSWVANQHRSREKAS